jgi:glycosyltransferase involved in cell wall biosynthesis
VIFVKIWLIQTGEGLPLQPGIRKLRTAVLAEELARRGHEVLWWAGAFSHLKKEWVAKPEAFSLQSGVDVRLLKGTGYRKNVSIVRFRDHRRVAAHFRSLLTQEAVPDAIVCALPPYDLARDVARYAKEKRIPLLMDARDAWPDVFVDVAPKFVRPMLRRILGSEFRMTSEAFSSADGITAMSADMLQWALDSAGRDRTDRDRVYHLGFKTAPPETGPTPDWLVPIQDRWIVAFVGTFSRFHSPATLVAAARILAKRGRDDIAFVIGGAGGDMESQVTESARGAANVVMPGWLDQEAIQALLQRARLGIAPTSVEAKFFPNKVFLYFSHGLPVLSSFIGELRTVLNDGGLGAGFEMNDADQLADLIVRFKDQEEHYRAAASRVAEAFAARYNETTIYGKFADHIESLVT